MAGRPPTTAMVTAIVKEANRPSRGSTPAMIEKAIASGMRARPTTRPARTSVLSRRGDLRVSLTDCSCSGVGGASAAALVAIAGSVHGQEGARQRLRSFEELRGRSAAPGRGERTGSRCHPQELYRDGAQRGGPPVYPEDHLE